MKLALALWVFALAPCAPQPGWIGTQACMGCRLDRHVQITDSLRVLGVKPNECSKWVMQDLPAHDHFWISVSCWSSEHASCVMMQCPLLCLISPDDWLAFLQNLPSERRHDVVALAARGGAPADRLFRECELWLAQRTAGAGR